MSKKWIIVFFSVATLIVVMLGTLNYVADPFRYWASIHGNIDNMSTYSPSTLSRHIKTNYIKRNSEKYSAVIFGGSNAGAIDPELMTNLTGNKTYNFYSYNGDFSDYFYSTKYCIKTMPNLKEIFIQISNGEMHAAKKEFNDKLPADIIGESVFWEKLSFLIFSPSETINYFLKILKPKTLMPSVAMLFIPKENKHPLNGVGDTIDGKMEIFSENISEEEQMKLVMNGQKMQETGKLSYRLKKLFSETEKDLDFSTALLSIENLKKIKELCNQNDIKLTVAICPSFIGKKAGFEGEQYYSWIRELALITPVWDFGGFFDANLNPYNFYEADHYNYETADEMLRIIYGEKENPDFGILLTPLNIEQYIIDRRQKFAELKDEYLKTGTVQLEEKEKSFRFRPTE